MVHWWVLGHTNPHLPDVTQVKYTCERRIPESKNWAIKVEPESIVCKALEMSEQWKTNLATLKRTQNKYPQFIMGVLARAKNGDEQFWK
jgi:hypothetical protein